VTQVGIAKIAINARIAEIENRRGADSKWLGKESQSSGSKPKQHEFGNQEIEIIEGKVHGRTKRDGAVLTR